MWKEVPEAENSCSLKQLNGSLDSSNWIKQQCLGESQPALKFSKEVCLSHKIHLSIFLSVQRGLQLSIPIVSKYKLKTVSERSQTCLFYCCCFFLYKLFLYFHNILPLFIGSVTKKVFFQVTNTILHIYLLTLAFNCFS